MSKNWQWILDLEAEFEKNRFEKPVPQEFLDIATKAYQVKCALTLAKYIEEGGPLNVVQSRHFTETMFIAKHCNIDGLSLYRKNGGLFRPDFKDKHGANEFMKLMETHDIEKDELVTFFAQNGGRLNPAARTHHGTSEIQAIIYHTHPKEKTMKALQAYIDHGGTFSKDAACTIRGHNELMDIVEYCGYEGLELFINNGGLINPSFRGTRGLREMHHVVRTGPKGLQLYLDSGGKFQHSTPDGRLTDAMVIAMYGDIEILKFFVENGGCFQPDVKNKYGFTEAMLIATFLGPDGIALFMDHGGTYTPENIAMENGTRKVTEKEIFEKAFHGTVPGRIRAKSQKSAPPRTQLHRTPKP